MSQQINLYEARLRPRHELAIARNVGFAALALLVLMISLSLWARFDANRKSEVAVAFQKQMTDEQDKLVALSKLAAQRRVSPALLAEQESARAMLAARQEVVDYLDSGKLGNTSGFSALMAGFARQTQGSLWLTGFQVTQGGEEIEIRGRLLDPARLPAYVQQLRSEPVFQGRRFAALEMHGVDPDDQNPPVAGKVADAGVSSLPPAPLVANPPRFVEFALRSENAVAAEGAARAGEKK